MGGLLSSVASLICVKVLEVRVDYPDMINGLFEFCGSIVLWRSVYVMYKDKGYLGIHWLTVGFFSIWGYWNMYYYPSLDQWLSFTGGLSITLANTIWLVQMLYYGRKE